ncbi:hypothetical protein [Streptomyces sp. NPDC055210]
MHRPQIQPSGARGQTTRTDVPCWESDLIDLAHVSLSALDSVPPLNRADRLLDEVLRPRGSMRGGGEPGRAE